MTDANPRGKGIRRIADSLCRKAGFRDASIGDPAKECEMRIALFVLTAAIAAPVLAQRMPPALPFAPRGIDYVETVCTGGFDGRYDVVRLLANGQVSKATRRKPEVQYTRATRGEVNKIWRQLDFARFEQRTVPSQRPYIMDGVDCTLTRRMNGRIHSVTLMQQMRDSPKYRDLTTALDDVNALGNRATGPRLRPAGQLHLSHGDALTGR